MAMRTSLVGRVYLGHNAPRASVWVKQEARVRRYAQALFLRKDGLRESEHGRDSDEEAGCVDAHRAGQSAGDRIQRNVDARRCFPCDPL